MEKSTLFDEIHSDLHANYKKNNMIMKEENQTFLSKCKQMLNYEQLKDSSIACFSTTFLISLFLLYLFNPAFVEKDNQFNFIVACIFSLFLASMAVGIQTKL